MKKHRVYLINQEGTAYYKIGVTSKPVEDRIKGLQTGNPNKLQLVESFETSYGFVLEKTLQRSFGYKRSREGGSEWFELELADLKKFSELCIMTEYNLEVLETLDNPFIKKIAYD